MTGKAPVPVPTTSRRHFQGIFSSIESGVCPNSPRNCLDGFFLAPADSPAIDHHVMLVRSLIYPDCTKRKYLKARKYRACSEWYANYKIEEFMEHAVTVFT